MRILFVGAGVIGSVYAVKLLEAGHGVVLLARGRRLMVRATRETFRVLTASGNAEIPANLRMLYLRPTDFIVRYWRRVFAGPRGELWFAAHSRAAPGEMHALANELQTALRRIGQPTPNLDKLLSRLPSS